MNVVRFIKCMTFHKFFGPNFIRVLKKELLICLFVVADRLHLLTIQIPQPSRGRPLRLSVSYPFSTSLKKLPNKSRLKKSLLRKSLFLPSHDGSVPTKVRGRKRIPGTVHWVD